MSIFLRITNEFARLDRGPVSLEFTEDRTFSPLNRHRYRHQGHWACERESMALLRCAPTDVLRIQRPRAARCCDRGLKPSPRPERRAPSSPAKSSA